MNCRAKGLGVLGAWLGATSNLAQILFIRELTAAFGGNELAVAVAFGAWLLGVAIGAALGSTVRGSKLTVERILCVATVLAVPIAIAGIRFIRSPAAPPLGPTDLLLGSLVLVVPIAALLGARFALLAAACDRPLRLFAVEAGGFAVAGLFLSPGLLTVTDPFRLILIAGLLDVALHVRFASGVARRWLLVPALLLLPCIVLSGRLESRLEERFFAAVAPGTIAREHGLSPFGALAARERVGETTLYRGGRLLISLGAHGADRPLATFTALRSGKARVALVAGLVGPDLVEQWARLGVESVRVVADDAATYEFLDRSLKRRGNRPEHDTTVDVRTGDVRDVLRRDESRYDVILVRSGEPDSLAASRSYSVRFFAEAERRLEPGGAVLVGPLVTSGSGSIVELIERNRILLASAAAVFSAVGFTASPCYLVATRGPEPAVPDEDELRARASERGIDLDDVDLSGLLEASAVARLRHEALTGEAWDPLSDAVDDARMVAAHMDRTPRALFASLLLECRLVDDPLGPWLELLGRMNRAVLFAVLAAVLALLLITCAASRPGRVIAVPFFAGLFGATAQVLLLLAFQIQSGQLIPQLGLLSAGFMTGTAWAALRAEPPVSWSTSLGLLALATVGLWFLLPVPAFPPSLSVLLFVSLCAVCGAVVGTAFAVGLRRSSGSSAVPGLLFAADAAGASLGAILLAGILLPLLGVHLIALLGALSCLSLPLCARRDPR